MAGYIREKKVKQNIFLVIVLFAVSVYAQTGGRNSFQSIVKNPGSVTIVTERGKGELLFENDLWKRGNIEVRTIIQKAGMKIELSAPGEAVKYVILRWENSPLSGWRYLGDTWERAYGNLQWLSLEETKEMPWYFLSSDGTVTHGYGVMTAPASMCSWFISKDSITLKMDVRNGGKGVLLGGRKLELCTVVARRGKTGENPFKAAQEFCKIMCPKPLLPKQPVYGFNDWYCDYGKNSPESVLYYASFAARLSPKGKNLPFMVIDDGWQKDGGNGYGGPWDKGNEKFPSMSQLALEIKKAGARPAIWVHLLTAQENQPENWRLKHNKKILDISLPEVRAYIYETVARIKGWGYELLKHDYSTFDISQGWGKSAGAAPDAEWTFADRSRTTAEIILDHYRSIREAFGDNLIIGCNTISHLSAGVFEIQRIGDDTSGKEWRRIVKYGVNSLAFRAPQHNTFYAADADCIGLTEKDIIPWENNKQWLDLLSRSGTPLFISFKKDSISPEQEKEIAEALKRASVKQPLAEPLDWFTNIQPVRWKLMGKEVNYSWSKEGKIIQ